MKKHLSTIFIVLFLGWFLFNGTNIYAGPWKKYIKLLKKVYKELTPYSIPNDQDGPGTVFIKIGNFEHLYYLKASAFPTLQLHETVVPAFFMSEIKEIKFKIGAKSDDQRIIPQNIFITAGIAIDRNTTLRLGVNNPKLIRLESGIIDEKLQNFDINIPRQKMILEKLTYPNTVILAGSLKVDSFTFTFERGSKINVSLEASIKNKANEAKLAYSRVSDKSFRLHAVTPIYIAYYPHLINTREARKLLDDKMKDKELTAETKRDEKRVDTLGEKIKKVESDKKKLENFKKLIKKRRPEINKIKDKIATIESQKEIRTSQLEIKELNSQIKEFKKEVECSENEINQWSEEIKKLNQNISNLVQNQKELTKLKKNIKAKKREIEMLKKRKYKLIEKPEDNT